jgi:hypothetical protein
LGAFPELLSCLLASFTVMPISAEQWRGSVGGNNAGRSRVLGKCTRGNAPNSLFGQFLLFLTTLFSPGPCSRTNINDREGEAGCVVVFEGDLELVHAHCYAWEVKSAIGGGVPLVG